MINEDYKVLIKRLVLAFHFYPATRLLFYLYNTQYFSNFGAKDLGVAFLWGLRFDLATLLIANIPFILLSLVPLRGRFYQFFLKMIYCLSNTFWLSLNFIDLQFFQFIGRKLTFDILGIAGDIEDQVLQLSYHYWDITLLVLISFILLWKLYAVRKKSKAYPIGILRACVQGILLLAFTFIGIRGGAQLRSISPKDAFIHEHHELGNLSLNAAYTFARSIGKKEIDQKKYYPTDEEALLALKKIRSFVTTPLEHKKANVVIIIMESFSYEYYEKGYMPFLKELSLKSAFYRRHLANGRRSIEALPSILTGFPSVIGRPLYQSVFQTNKYYPLPQTLKMNGYKTAFFHGGKSGTMDFDSYCYSIGIDRYYSMNDYPNIAHYDGHWGISDHYFFDFMANELKTFSEPFMAGFFSLSSHQPYIIPSEFQGKFPKGKLEIHESIGYADYALRSFFGKIQNEPWYKNTLFVITADHTQQLETQKFQNQLGHYRVPLILYYPGENLTRFSNDKIAQQVDIVPSVLDFLGIIPEKRLYFGRSLFNNDVGRAFYYNDGNFTLVSDEYLVNFNDDKQQLFQFDKEMGTLVLYEDKDLSDILLGELKAYIQYAYNGLLHNNIYRD